MAVAWSVQDFSLEAMVHNELSSFRGSDFAMPALCPSQGAQWQLALGLFDRMAQATEPLLGLLGVGAKGEVVPKHEARRSEGTDLRRQCRGSEVSTRTGDF